MILTDREIGLALDAEEIIIAPRPVPECVSSSAIDLTLANTGLDWEIADGDPITFELRPGFKISSIVKFQKPVPFTPYRLEPGKFVLGWTAEKIKIPVKSRLAARVEGKSQLARLGIGVHINAPTVHAGFPSEKSPPQPLQLEIFNYSNMTYNLHPGLRICQLIIEQTLGTPNTGYEGQFSVQGGPQDNTENLQRREFRRRLLEISNFRCKACGADLRFVKFEIDHIHPKSKGGSDHPSNLQILCAACNREKSAQFMKDWAPGLLNKDGTVINSWEELGWETPNLVDSEDI